VIRQDLGEWIKNNWRAERIIRSAGTGRKKSAVDIVCDTMDGQVRAELQRMWDGQQNAEDAPGPMPSVFTFTKRTTAAKKVLAELGDNEKAAIKTILSTKQPELAPDIKQE
jgi:hypothetical protein